MAITLLPGRKDYKRDLREDLSSIKAQGIHKILCLVPMEELHYYGVSCLLDTYRNEGFDIKHAPILDQKIPSIELMNDMIDWARKSMSEGHSVLVHCVGGLGRSGMIAAVLLRSYGVSSEDALKLIRKNRSQRAIETAIQEEFVRRFPFD